MSDKDMYEAVIGLEVHIELDTETKMFCPCKREFGAAPNSNICPVCMGLPGAMPVLNKRAVELAVRAGIAVGAKISPVSRMARKNYFYPDMPKAYQISQYDEPLCVGGDVWIGDENKKKRVGITRIHIEEDAGKLLHGDGSTKIDHNRCGVPLIEIVSEPDIRSAEEAKAYLSKLRSLMMFAGVSQCKMNEGHLRCDVNLSVRKKGDTELGVRTEIKNLNSFQFVGKAIECEFERQVTLLAEGKAVMRETRRYDEKAQKSFRMRLKESESDYRFFDEPDIPPVAVSAETVEKIRRSLPKTAEERKRAYIEKYGVSQNDAETLTAEPSIADWYEACAENSKYPKLCAAFLLTDISGSKEGADAYTGINALRVSAVADIMGDGEINSATAKKLIRLLCREDFDPLKKVDEEDLRIIRDTEKIRKIAIEAVAEDPRSAADYKNGKKSALKAVMGRAMAKSGGRADPLLLNDALVRVLEGD